jgi:hypothetical protein
MSVVITANHDVVSRRDCRRVRIAEESERTRARIQNGLVDAYGAVADAARLGRRNPPLLRELVFRLGDAGARINARLRFAQEHVSVEDAEIVTEQSSRAADELVHLAQRLSRALAGASDGDGEPDAELEPARLQTGVLVVEARAATLFAPPKRAN